jgi:hypothetical protein
MLQPLAWLAVLAGSLFASAPAGAAASGVRGYAGQIHGPGRGVALVAADVSPADNGSRRVRVFICDGHGLWKWFTGHVHSQGATLIIEPNA